jgi:two-component system chemotaxis sensor kinase CheA
MADDLIIEFLTETNESLDALDQDFVRLEQNPNDKGIINNIFRVMHTIKGTCGFLGLHRLEKVAHAAENIMDQIRSDVFKITPPVISLILEANDKIKSLIEHLGENGSEPEGEDSDLIARLNKTAKSGVVEGNTPAPAPVSKPEVATASKTPDLDEEIDFEPIKAEYAGGGASAPEASAPKTPDLDQEIDFTPITADYAASEVVPTANVPAKKIELPEEVKKEAINAGLNATDADKKDATTSQQQSIRVNIDILETLMQMVGELVLTRNQLLQLKRASKTSLGAEFDAPLQRLNHITTDLQEGVMKTRMQPIGNAWAKFPRLIRDLAVELNKKIELKMIGADTELDRQMLEAIKDPLTHMVRNSADHGVETPDVRIAAGKKPEGIVTLSAYHEGGHIIIKVADDGKGLNVERIKAKAIEKGLVSSSEAANLSEKQIFQFILKAGFSTAEKITAVSGRGVGMDVVVSNIEKIGGTIELFSKEGKGSEFLIKLPLTLAIMPVLIVKSVDETFAIPQIRVSEIVKVEDERDVDAKYKTDEDKLHKIEEINGAPVLRLRGRLLSLVSLSGALRIPRPEEDKQENFVVVCEMGSNTFGVMVDKVFHTEEIVVKPKTPLIADVEVFSGSTILGDGSVIMIVDPNGVLKASGISALNENAKLEDQKSVFDEEEISFLTFKTQDNTPKAIPLELVSRLEEVDLSKVEYSGDNKVIQYRGTLMRLIALNGEEVPETGSVQDTIVFVDRDKVMGIVVQQINDIVRMKMDIKSSISGDGVLGSMIINGATTDVIDVSYYFGKTFDGWLGHSEANVIEGQEKVELYKPHILLVDDSPFFRKFMRPVILAANYRVSTCENGLEAMEMLRANYDKIDLVISDIDMPKMNGLEFITAAMQDENIKKIPFVALTSHEAEDFDKSPKEYGFAGFVSKSERDKVVGMIGEIIGEKRINLAS